MEFGVSNRCPIWSRLSKALIIGSTLAQAALEGGDRPTGKAHRTLQHCCKWKTCSVFYRAFTPKENTGVICYGGNIILEGMYIYTISSSKTHVSWQKPVDFSVITLW